MDEVEIQALLETKFSAFKSIQTELQNAQKDNASKAELTKLITSVTEQGQVFEDYIEAQKARIIVTVEKQLEEFIIENKDVLIEMKNSRRGVIEFIPKVPEAIDTASGVDITTPPVNRSTSLGHFNYENNNAMLNLFTMSRTSNDSLVYTELTPKDGDYTFVAEAGTKPQIDFKWENRHITPHKIAAHEVLTEEAVTDVKRLTSVAREYLRVKHDLFKVDSCYFGDGTGIKAKGATVYGRTFVVGTMANVFPTGTSNFMDVVNACITDIYTTHNYTDESAYKANIVLIHPEDFFVKLVGAKDGNGLPLYPQAGLFNQVSIGGVTIKPWYKIPVGKIFVADASKYNVVNYIPFSIRIGWIDDQFITNQFTMVGESRFFAYVKNLDEQAFIYDTIATVQAAITA